MDLWQPLGWFMWGSNNRHEEIARWQRDTLMSLEPAAAALAGLVLLDERLGAVQWLAIACVVVASAGVTRSTATQVGAPA